MGSLVRETRWIFLPIDSTLYHYWSRFGPTTYCVYKSSWWHRSAWTLAIYPSFSNRSSRVEHHPSQALPFLWFISWSLYVWTFNQSRFSLQSAVTMETQTTKGLQHQIVHVYENRSSILYATSSIMILLTSVAMFVRIYCNRKLRAPIGPDDFTILVALVIDVENS